MVIKLKKIPFYSDNSSDERLFAICKYEKIKTLNDLIEIAIKNKVGFKYPLQTTVSYLTDTNRVKLAIYASKWALLVYKKEYPFATQAHKPLIIARNYLKSGFVKENKLHSLIEDYAMLSAHIELLGKIEAANACMSLYYLLNLIIYTIYKPTLIDYIRSYTGGAVEMAINSLSLYEKEVVEIKVLKYAKKLLEEQ